MPAPPPESEPAIVNARGTLVLSCDVCPLVFIKMAIPPGARPFPRRATHSAYSSRKSRTGAPPPQGRKKQRVHLAARVSRCLLRQSLARHRYLASLRKDGQVQEELPQQDDGQPRHRSRHRGE